MPGNVLTTVQPLSLVKVTVTCLWWVCPHVASPTRQQHLTRLIPSSFLEQSTLGFLVSFHLSNSCFTVSSGGPRAPWFPSLPRLPWGCNSLEHCGSRGGRKEATGSDTW